MKNYYEEENEKVQDSYDNTIKKIKEIVKETTGSNNKEKMDYFKFFNITGKFIIKLCKYEEVLNDKYFSSKSFEELLQENNELFDELLHYHSSYSNPKYAVKIFGDKYGQLMSHFYDFYRRYIDYAFSHKVFIMEDYNKLFIDVYQYIKDKTVEYESLNKLITSINFTDLTMRYYYLIKEQYDPQFGYYTDIIQESDLNDLRYLFKAGKYISDNEIRLAKFLLTYPEDKLESLSQQIVKAYLKGFKENNIDIGNRSNVAFYYKISLERLYKKVIEEFRKEGLETSVYTIISTTANKQHEFDHKFDDGLFLSEEFVKIRLENISKGLEKNKDVLDKYSGIMVFDTFGEAPFSPESKAENVKLSEGQQKLFQNFISQASQLQLKYTPRSKTSFSIIAFPSPEISKDQFEEIFEAILEINKLDSEKYERIQQIMIDVLDTADYVHVKGKGENITDIKVKMPPLKDPKKESNFVNCGATINIPVGEVFTSPQLSGTNGMLHVEETYQNELKFEHLKLEFEDGYITNYSCTNYEKEEENLKYIEENLLFPHKTLPIGEFAIGTNTLAYVVSRKYNILNVLPVLIVEKTGPHFAVGDTCFAHREDHKFYNLITGKEIVARDNEKTLLRKSGDMRNAYLNKHNDITLAFDSIDFITAITKEGKRIDIIKDGRFVLKGTEELNQPLDDFLIRS